MYSTTSFVDYEVYEKVDVTELAWEQCQHQGIAMESLPAALITLEVVASSKREMMS